MSTLVGTQNDFKLAVKELIELDYDAVEAYNAAISRIEDVSIKLKLEEFKSDHKRHISELSALLHLHNVDAPKQPSIKQWLTKGKVFLGGLIGDRAILHAMLSNEQDTNTAYDRMRKHPNVWADSLTILQQGYEDEKKHKKWIEETYFNLE